MWKLDLKLQHNFRTVNMRVRPHHFRGESWVKAKKEMLYLNSTVNMTIYKYVLISCQVHFYCLQELKHKPVTDQTKDCLRLPFFLPNKSWNKGCTKINTIYFVLNLGRWRHCVWGFDDNTMITLCLKCRQISFEHTNGHNVNKHIFCHAFNLTRTIIRIRVLLRACYVFLLCGRHLLLVS